MPRNIDPSSITTGTGLAAQDSVQANALIAPTGSNDGLRVHIADPSRAHMARAIGVEDVDDNFASDHVEGALAELAGGTSSIRTNGLVEGGTFAASAGLTFELDAPTQVLLGSGIVSLGGVQVALADNATQYVWVNSSTGNLVATLSPPLLSTDPILIAEVTTAAGSITGSRDLRFFVFKLDRKNALIVRSSGTSFDQRAEANFLSLQAVLAYLDLYAGSPSSDPVETHQVIIRGNHDIAATQVVPVDGVVFVGDGDASITATATLAPMFDISGRERVAFKSLTFIAGAANSTALGAPTGLTADTVVDGCRFESGVSDWLHAVDLPNVATHTRAVLRNSVLSTADDAVSIFQASECLLASLEIQQALGTPAGTGVFVQSALGGGHNTVQDSSITGFSVGVNLVGDRNSAVRCKALSIYEHGFIVNTGTQCTVQDCQVILSGAAPMPASLSGIQVGTTQSSVSGCSINNLRAGGLWTGVSFVTGIRVLTGADDTTLHANVVQNFWNEFDDTGYGIFVDDNTERCVVSSNRVEVAPEGISTGVACSDLKVHGNTIHVTGSGITVAGSGITVSDNNILLDVDHGLLGIVATGSDAKILGCSLTNPRTVWAGAEVPVGISLGGDAALVSNCSVSGFLNATGGEGIGVRIAGGLVQCKVVGNQIHTTHTGVALGLGTERCSVLSNEVSGVESGVLVEGANAPGSRSRRHTLSDNLIWEATGHGVHLLGRVHDCVVANNNIDLYVPTNGANQTATGILVAIDGTDVPFNNLIEGNEVQRGREGITITGDLSNRPTGIKVQDNLVHHCGRALDVSLIATETFAVYPHGIGINHCDECTVQGNTIRRLGVITSNLDVEAFPDEGLGVNDVRSVGISIWNSDTTTVQGNQITNLLSANDGRAYGIYLRQGNSGSAVLLEQGHHSITNNVIGWDTGLAGFGLGVHGVWVEVTPDTDVGSSTLQDLQVVSNSIRRTLSSGIEILAGARSVLENLSVSNNSLHLPCTGSSGEAEGGIRVHTSLAAAATTTASVRHVQVHGNQVRDSGSSGIRFTPSQEGDFRSFQVHDNSIQTPARAGILLTTPATPAGIVVSDWSVQDNRVSGWGTLTPYRDGVGFYDANKATTGFFRLNISNNDLVSSLAGLQGVTIQTEDRDVESLHIAGNNISSLGTTTGSNLLQGTGVYILLARDTADPPALLSQANVLDNTISVTNAQAILADVFSNVSALNIKGNTLAASGTGRCLDLQLLYPAGLANQEYNQFVIEGNTLTGNAGLRVDSTRANIQNSSISDNAFQGLTEGALVSVKDTTFDVSFVTRNLTVARNTFRDVSAFGVHLDLGAGGVGPSSFFENVQVVENSFYAVGSAGTGSVVEARMWGVLRNSAVCRNQFAGCLGSLESDTISNIRLRLGASSEAGCIQVNVDGNQMEGCGGTGIRVDNTAAGAVVFTTNALSVSKNNLYETGNTAIFLDLNSFTASQRTTVEGNLIQGKDAAPALGESGGIHIRGCTLSHGQVRVTSNELRRVARNTVAAIQVSCPGELHQVVVSGNTITDSNRDGILVSGDEILNNVVVDNNNMLDVLLSGIRVVGTGGTVGAGLASLSVCGNTLRDIGSVTDAGISVEGQSGVAAVYLNSGLLCNNSITGVGGRGILVSAHGSETLSLSGNTVLQTSLEGIFLEPQGALLWSHTVLSGNSIRDVGTGIRIDRLDGVMSGTVISGNSIGAPGDYGIRLESLNNWVNAEVSNNTINGFSVSGLRLYGSNIRESSISGNHCSAAAATNHICYEINVPNELTVFSFSGNTAESSGLSQSVSLRLDTSGGTPAQTATSFVGNVFASSDLGIVVVSSPTTNFIDSLVVGNLSHDLGVGAVLWGNGGPGTFTDTVNFNGATCTLTNNQG